MDLARGNSGKANPRQITLNSQPFYGFGTGTTTSGCVCGATDVQGKVFITDY